MDLVKWVNTRSELALYVMICGLVVLGGLFGFLYAGHFVSDQSAEIKKLTGSLHHTQLENTRLNLLVSEQKVALALQEGSTEVLLENMTATLTEQRALKEKVTMYEQVMSKDTVDSYLTVQTIKVDALPEENKVLLTLLLVQGRALKSTIYGNLDLHITGFQGNKAKTYKVADLLSRSLGFVEKNSPLSYKYQYFIERFYVLAIPEGFTPETLTFNTNVMQWKRKRAVVSEQYVWSDILAAATE